MSRTKRVVFDEATAASHVVIAAPEGGKRLRIKGVHLISAGTVDLTFEDSDGTNLTGLYSLAAQTIISLPLFWGDDFYLETGFGKGFNILLGSAVQVGGFIIYQVDD